MFQLGDLRVLTGEDKSSICTLQRKDKILKENNGRMKKKCIIYEQGTLLNRWAVKYLCFHIKELVYFFCSRHSSGEFDQVSDSAWPVLQEDNSDNIMKNGLEWRILEKQRSVWKEEKKDLRFEMEKKIHYDVESIEFDKQVELRNDWGNSKKLFVILQLSWEIQWTRTIRKQ